MRFSGGGLSRRIQGGSGNLLSMRTACGDTKVKSGGCYWGYGAEGENEIPGSRDKAVVEGGENVMKDGEDMDSARIGAGTSLVALPACPLLPSQFNNREKNVVGLGNSETVVTSWKRMKNCNPLVLAVSCMCVCQDGGVDCFEGGMCYECDCLFAILF